MRTAADGQAERPVPAPHRDRPVRPTANLDNEHVARCACVGAAGLVDLNSPGGGLRSQVPFEGLPDGLVGAGRERHVRKAGGTVILVADPDGEHTAAVVQERRDVLCDLLAAGTRALVHPEHRLEVQDLALPGSDYYVLILAGRYGSVDPETHISWTEREYRYARDEARKPILVFIRTEDAITQDKAEQTPAGRRRRKAFLETVSASHLVTRWRTKEELALAVSQTLMHRIRQDEADGNQPPGWFRGTEVASQGTIDEFARLTRENEELRGKLQSSVETNSPIIEPRWSGALRRNVLPFKMTTFDWQFGGDQGSFSHQSGQYGIERSNTMTYLWRKHNMIPFDTELRNTGWGPARALVVDLRCEGMGEVLVRSPPRIFGHSDPIDEERERIAKDQARPAFLDIVRPLENALHVRFRVRTIPRDGSEFLPQFWLVPSMAILSRIGEAVDVPVRWRLFDEHGDQGEGGFKIRLEVNEHQPVSAQTTAKLLLPG